MTLVEEIPPTSPEQEQAAVAYEECRAKELKAQYKNLRRLSQAHFSAVKGALGIKSQRSSEEILAKVEEEFESGQFLLERMGGHRYIDPELAALLLKLRRDILAVIPNPTAIDKMHVDMAVVGYRNFLRFQAMLDSVFLVVERELFGEAPLNEIHGSIAGENLKRDLKEVEEKILPLMERAQRMVTRATSQLGKHMSG